MAKQRSPRIACPVLSTVEVKKMGCEKTVLPLADVQNHLPATARNERHGPYEQCHALPSDGQDRLIRKTDDAGFATSLERTARIDLA
jgi:hypothetical protein